MRSLLTATGLFTIVPVRPFEVDRAAATRAMAALPWLGLLLGLAAGVVSWGLGTLASPLLGAVAGLALLAAATGALHLDGVADTADGLGSRRPREEALDIMRRSDIGPMGVVTLLFVLGCQVAALAGLGEPLLAGAALAVAVAFSRLAVTVATVSKASARAQGFGALFVGVTSRLTAWLSAISLIAAGSGLGWLVLGPQGALLFAGAAVLAGGLAWWWGSRLVRRFGGWTGDTFGSLIEVTQTAYLLFVALGAGLL